MYKETAPGGIIQMANTLRELQLCELQILKDFRTICERHGFKYYLTGGTLLGAVRHRGFIPWDDDVDIMMPIEDYQRFLGVAQQELGENYFVQNAETDKSDSVAYTHIRKNHTAVFNEWNRYDRTHHGAWIDISPLVRVKGARDRRIKNTLLKICYFLIMDDAVFSVTASWFDKMKKRLHEFVSYYPQCVSFHATASITQVKRSRTGNVSSVQ